MMTWKMEQRMEVIMLTPLLLLPHLSEMRMLTKRRGMMRKTV